MFFLRKKSLTNNFIYYWLIDSYLVISKKSHQKYIKYIFRYLKNWSINYNWSKYINSTDQHKRWKFYYGCDLFSKVQYPYLSLHFTKEEQLNSLKQHYDWFFLNIKEDYYYNEINLFSSTFTDSLENNYLVEIYLQCKSSFEYEGEMSLLMKVNRDIQYTLTFLQILYNQKLCTFIGGLQAGKQDVTNLDGLKNLTKTMHGLRPKQFILHSLSIFSNQFDINEILAISNQNHVFSKIQKRWSKKKIKTSLDSFWEEFDATRTKKNNYIFKPLSNIINLEEIVSKKRSQYRKRQTILNELNRQITNNLIYIKK